MELSEREGEEAAEVGQMRDWGQWQTVQSLGGLAKILAFILSEIRSPGEFWEEA